MPVVGMPAPPQSAFELNERSTSYLVDGVLRAPKTLRRVVSTPTDLQRVIREAMTLHGLAEEDVIERTSLAPQAIDDVISRSKGAPRDVLAILDAVGVEPVTIPSLQDLERGVPLD